MDVRVGGRFRWRWRSDEDGKEFGFEGEYLDVQPAALLRNTESFDSGDVGGSMGEKPAVVTVSFDERGGGGHHRGRSRTPRSSVSPARSQVRR